MNEPYFIEVETNPCPHCHKGRTWTIIGPDGGCAVGESWSSDDEDECPEEAEVICEALNSAFREGQTIMVGGMVNRFLTWPLPQDFAPDCGISFDGRKDDEWNKNKTWPVGTNLLTADQARAMLEHVLGTQPDEGRPVPPHATGPASYYPPAETQPCFMCMGHGVTVSGHASAPKMKECSHCHGSGRVPPSEPKKDDANPCACCGCRDIGIVTSYTTHKTARQCDKCHFQGPFHASLSEATRLWNECHPKQQSSEDSPHG